MMVPIWLVLGMISGIMCQPDISYEIDYTAKLLMDYYDVPGASLVVVVNGTQIYKTTGYGYRNIEKEQPVTTNTLFSIGSLTKAFTATLMVKHLKALNFTLDTPLSDILGNKTVILSDRFRTEYITPRDLMSHRTCLDATNLALLAGLPYDRDGYVWRQRYLPQVCGFRSVFLYNNQMFTLAGWVLEQLTGKKWEILVKEELFDPLGMNGTKILADVVDHFDELDAVTPYAYDRGNIRPIDIEVMKRVTPQDPCGGISSNAEDMGKWLMFHLNGGEGIVDQATLSQLYDGVISDYVEYNIPIPNFFEMYHSYAQAFGIGVTNDENRYMHGGYWTNQASQLSLFPERQIGIFSTTNGPGSSRGGSFNLLLHDIIYELLTIGQYDKEIFNNLDAITKILESQNIGERFAPSVVPSGATKNYTADSPMPFLESNDIPSDSDVQKYAGMYGNLLYDNLTVTVTEVGELFLNYYWIYGPLNETSQTDVFHLNMTENPIRQDLEFNRILTVFSGENRKTNKMEFCDLTFNGYPYRFVRGLKLEDGPSQLWNDSDC